MATEHVKVALIVTMALSTLSWAFCFVDAQVPPPQEAAQPPELNTILMESTFRLEGKNAKGASWFGTAFLVGRPMKDASKLRYVLVTAAHVVEPLVGDEAVLMLRHRVNGHWEVLPTRFPIRTKGVPLMKK
jgi:hypothetical protein